MACGLLGLGGPHVSGQASGPTPPAGTPPSAGRAAPSAIRAILETAGRTPPPRTAELAQQLGALGPGAIPDLCATLVGQPLHGAITPPPVPDGAEVPPPPLELTAQQREALAKALQRHPQDLLAFLRSVATGDVSEDRKLLVLRVLGGAGDADGLPLYLEMASTIDPIHYLLPAIGNTVQNGLHALLRRHPEAMEDLKSALPKLPDACAQRALQGVAAVGTPEAVVLLEGCLSRTPERIVDLLALLSELGGRDPDRLQPTTRQTIHELLTDKEPRLRMAAAQALGRLRDAEAVPSLIDVLTDEDPEVRQAALWSLRLLSGRSFTAKPEEWTAWHAAEQAWFQASGADLIQRLASGEDRVVIAALGETLVRRLFQAQLVPGITGLLEHANPAIRTAACQCLGRLQSPLAVDALLGALEHEDQSLHAAAARALSAITGRTLPPDPQAWREALGG